MANFQIGHSRLFPDGAELFVNGMSGSEMLVLHSGNKIQLELVGMGDSTSPPTVTVSDITKVSYTAPRKLGRKWMVTVQAIGAGRVTLRAVDSHKRVTPDLTVVAGVFKNHPDMEDDLIANIFRGHDPAKMYALEKILGNAPDNIVNENSKGNIAQWGELACGTMAKVTGRDVFYSHIDYDYKPYNKPIRDKITKRSDIRYDDAKLTHGENAIQARLKRGQPSVVGLVWNPTGIAIEKDGSLKITSPGGHSVLIVACDKDAKKFLYFDPCGPSETQNQAGSLFQYKGGMSDGPATFPDKCKYLGMFVEFNDPARGRVLIQDPSSQAPAGFEGDQCLEVVSGPLR
jgi:hypothetical protein